MNALEHMNLVESEIPLDIANDPPFTKQTQDVYDVIRFAFEEHLNRQWRVISLAVSTRSHYASTLNSRTDEFPEYIFVGMDAAFDITAIENGPLDRSMDALILPVHKKHLYCKALLTSTGNLQITESTMSTPKR